VSVENELYRQAIEKWGVEAQLVILMEECGELIQAVSKYLRNGCPTGDHAIIHNLLKEAQDVRLLINQLEYGIIPKPSLWNEYRKWVIENFKIKLFGLEEVD